MDPEALAALVTEQAAQIEALTAQNEAKDATIAEQGALLATTAEKVEAIEMGLLDQELASLTPVELPRVAAQHWVAKTAGLGVYVVSDTPPTDAEVSYSDGLIGYVCYPQGLKDLAGNDVTVVRQGLEDSAQLVVVPTADLAFTGKTRSWEYIEDGADVTAILIESD
jgi:hypothetical protein